MKTMNKAKESVDDGDCWLYGFVVDADVFSYFSEIKNFIVLNKSINFLLIIAGLLITFSYYGLKHALFCNATPSSPPLPVLVALINWFFIVIS